MIFMFEIVCFCNYHIQSVFDFSNFVFLVAPGKPPRLEYAARLPSFSWKLMYMANVLHWWQFGWKNVTIASLLA